MQLFVSVVSSWSGTMRMMCVMESRVVGDELDSTTAAAVVVSVQNPMLSRNAGVRLVHVPSV